MPVARDEAPVKLKRRKKSALDRFRERSIGRTADMNAEVAWFSWTTRSWWRLA